MLARENRMTPLAKGNIGQSEAWRLGCTDAKMTKGNSGNPKLPKT